MKKLILIMLCMLLLVGTVSASDWFGFDNYVKYDESIGDYGKIEVWDKGLFIIGEDTKLSETILERNDECLIDCVSTGTKTLYEETELFEGFDFYDRAGNKLDLDYEVYYWVEDLEVKIVNNYSCIKKELANKSIINDCSKINNTYEEYLGGWKLSDGKPIDKGTYKWKLEVNKPLGVNVDWVAKAENGVRYTPWLWYQGEWDFHRNMSNLSGTVSFVNLSYSNFTGANANFSDLEFVNNDLNSTYDFWIANRSNGSWATYYIETNGDSSLVVYYGNENKGSGDYPDWYGTYGFADVYPNMTLNYGAYIFDDGFGNKAEGVYKTGQAGTLHNMENEDWIDGNIGEGLILDGAYGAPPEGTEYVKFLNWTAWHNIADFTVLLWMYDSEPTGNSNLIAKHSGIGGWIVYTINDGTDRHILLQQSGSITNMVFESSDGTITSNHWHHIAIQIYANRTASIYIDGAETTYQTTTGGNDKQSNVEAYVCLGRNEINATDNPWQGKIDDVMLYNSLLTDSEIAKFNDTIDNDLFYVLGNEVNVSHNVTTMESADPVGEGDSVSYSLWINRTNIGVDWSETNATFTLNNTDYTNASNYIYTDGIKFIYNHTFDSSSGSVTGQNHSWNWTYNIQNATYTLTSGSTETENTTVYEIDFDDCSVHTIEIFNFTMVDEETQVWLNGSAENTSIKIDMDLYASASSTIPMLEFYDFYNQTNSARVCISKDLNDSDYYLSAQIEYYADDYAHEFYHIQDYDFNTSEPSQNITLYDLKDADSTEFKITFKDENFQAVENALIQIQRKYVDEGVFKTVEIPRTDSSGQTVGHLVRNDAIYNIYVTKDGVVLGVFKNVMAFCDDYLVGNCQIILDATSEEVTTFSYDEQLGIIFQSIPTYDENASAVSFDFLTNDGTVKTIFMEVTRDDIFGNRSICNNSLTSAGGTVSCIVPSIDDSVLRVKIYVDEQPIIFSNVKLEASDYGKLGYVLWFFITLIFILIFGKSKTGVLIALVISFIGAITLGITRGDVIGFGSAGIWVLVIAILGIWKLNKENPQ